MTAWVDPIALSSALDAVIDNALKFTPAREEVVVTVASGRDDVTVVVTDRGPGLTAQEMERIGDRFWRSTQHQNIQGSGLGLSISQALLAALRRLPELRGPRTARAAGHGLGAAQRPAGLSATA